jgi:hypothetical protein
MAFLANGNTSIAWPYADNVRMIEQYLLGCQMDNGIITSGSQEQGRPMYGHGFALLFLSEVYGMETDERTRQTLKKVIIDAVNLTARGQSSLGVMDVRAGQAIRIRHRHAASSASRRQTTPASRFPRAPLKAP